MGLAVRALAAAAVVALAFVLVDRPFFDGDTPEAPEAPGVTNEVRARRAPIRVTPVSHQVLPAADGLDRVTTPAGRDGWIEPVEPLGPPAIEYELEGWRAVEGGRRVHDF